MMSLKTDQIRYQLSKETMMMFLTIIVHFIVFFMLFSIVMSIQEIGVGIKYKCHHQDIQALLM